MKMSLPGLARNLRAMCDELVEHVEHGEVVDEDFVMEHQPRGTAFMVEEVLRNLRLVAADPTRLQEFLDFVDVKAPASPTSEVDRV